MEVHSLSQALKLIMEEHGWTQTQLAHELGVFQTTVSSMILGKKDTNTTNASKRLARVGWELVMRPKGDGPVKRREFVTAVASVAFIPSATTNAFQDPGYVRMLTERAARMRHELGGVPLVSTVMGQVRRVQTAVKGTDRELQAAASELAKEAMLTLYDARRFNDAERAGGTSLALARCTGDFPAQATAYNILSQISTYQGDGNRGARYAEQALNLPDLSGANRAYVRVRLGRALALVPGQERKTRTMLDQALSTDGIPAFETADISGNVGIALNDLGAYKKAHQTLAESSERIGQWSPLYQAEYLAIQTKAAICAGELSLAACLMHTLSEILPILDSAKLRQATGEILAASAPWADVTEVRNAREQLRAALPPDSRTRKL